MDTNESLFTKIIKGEVPSYKVYEDDKTYAFLDIDPLSDGHVLVVPKKQVDKFYDLDDESCSCACCSYVWRWSLEAASWLSSR